jgi:hypothetical protein
MVVQAALRFVGRTLKPDAASAGDLDRAAAYLVPFTRHEVVITGMFGGVAGGAKELAGQRARAVKDALTARGVVSPIEIRVERDFSADAPAPYVRLSAPLPCEEPPRKGGSGN